MQEVHVVHAMTSEIPMPSPTHYLPGLGGGGRIRTSEGVADRFTVCSLWPLGNPSIEICAHIIGASGGTRTPGRLITNQQLYQLSYAGHCKVRKNKIVKRRRRSSVAKPRI